MIISFVKEKNLPVWKSICPLNHINDCAKLGSLLHLAYFTFLDSIWLSDFLNQQVWPEPG